MPTSSCLDYLAIVWVHFCASRCIFKCNASNLHSTHKHRRCSVEHSPPTLPWPVGSSAVWASLPGRCQRSGGWWGSLVWSAGLLEVHNSPLGSALSGCPLPGVWKRQITLRWNDSLERNDRMAAVWATSYCEQQLQQAVLISVLVCVICFNVHVWKNAAGIIEKPGGQLW